MVESQEPGPTRSNPRRELVERQILDQAFALFASKGYARTSLQDIASATGLTRPALYHYISNKEELIERLVTEIAGHSAGILHEINEAHDQPPASRLYAMCVAIAQQQMASPDRFRLLISSENDLPDAVVDSYRSSRRAVLRELSAVIDDGQMQRVFRPCDSRVAALGIVGMLNWVAWWYHPGERDDSERIAAQLADMAIRSVMDPDPDVDIEVGPLGVVESLKRQLNDLEQLLSEEK